MAERILFASALSMRHLLSSSDDELLPSPISEEAFSTARNGDRKGTLLRSISCSGECSESDDEETGIIDVVVGEPPAFFARKPAWKRLERGLRSIDGSGGAGTGDELFELSDLSFASLL